MSQFDFKRDVDFKFIVPEEAGTSINVMLLTGEFAGVVYSYGKVSVNEDEGNEQAEISFEYDLVDSNGLENLEQNEGFKDHIGNILVSMVMENIPSEE